MIRFPGTPKRRKRKAKKRRRSLGKKLDKLVDDERFIELAVKYRITPEEWAELGLFADFMDDLRNS